jgi:hypothetical protein
MAFLVEALDAHRSLHSLDLLGGLGGEICGDLVGRLVSPGLPPDEMQINVRPGLGTRASF